MTPKILVYLFCATLFVSCGVNHCDYYCDTGPLSLSFVLLDSESGENLFTNGTYHLDELQILDIENDNATVPYIFISEDDTNQLILGPFGDGINTAHYAIAINTEILFSISLKTEEISDTCCTSIALDEFNIHGADFNQNATSGIFEILIVI